MTETQRVAGVIFSPARAFEDIDRRPTWILPLLLTLVVNLATQFVVYRVLVTDANFEQVARTKVGWDSQSAGRQNTPGDMQRQIETLRKQRGYWYVLPLVAIPLSVLSLSIFFFLVLRLARAGVSFRKIVAVLCWSFIIYRCIGGIFTIAALLVHGPANFFPAAPESWSPTSLAQIVSRTAVSPNLYSTISKLDVFLIWWLAVISIGFSKVSKNLSIARSAALVAVCEVVYLAANAAGWLRGVT